MHVYLLLSRGAPLRLPVGSSRRSCPAHDCMQLSEPKVGVLAYRRWMQRHLEEYVHVTPSLLQNSCVRT